LVEGIVRGRGGRFGDGGEQYSRIVFDKIPDQSAGRYRFRGVATCR
jgi:hypothetical protein